jgi:molecular chaperone HtpG
MSARKPLARSVEAENRVDPSAIRIGADIVELITSGMYVAPITVFREYAQNAADSIDQARARGLLASDERGRVEISIDHAARSVTIRDNGAGVAAGLVADCLLAIGGSTKRGTDARGFRGVGRLSGLAYCRELEFRTKAKCESVESRLVWDARMLRQGVADARKGKDLREVIAASVSLETISSDDAHNHFFEVTMHGVVRHRQDVLINEHAISAYLGQVAPVPFAEEFSFRHAIEGMLARHVPNRVPLTLTVAGQEVFRPFRDAMAFPGTDKKLIVNEIEFFELADVDGGVGAVGWLGHHDYIRSISTTIGVRGLRARIGDVQVGDPDLFDNSYREPRFNGWTIGEIHVIDHRLVPNGRRDNFEVNHHSNNLLVQIGPLALTISNRCRTASVSRNASVIIRNTIASADQLLESKSIDSLTLSRTIAAVRRGTIKLRGIRDELLRLELAAELSRLETALSGMTPPDQAGVVASDEAVTLINRIVTNREQATRLINELLKLRA